MRHLLPVVQASIDLPDALTPSGGHTSPMVNAGLRDGFVVVGSAVIVLILLVIYIVYFRGSGRRSPSRSKSVSKSTDRSALVKTEVVEGESGRRKVRYRRRRRDHRQRNPTLAETGGLPPQRPEHG